MTLQQYQEQASGTVQRYENVSDAHFLLGYLGLAGETGSVLTTLKKMLRDGEGFGSFEERLLEELGDVLWYIASIATSRNLSLEKIAEENLRKTQDRFQHIPLKNLIRLDRDYEEQFPDEFVINFIEEQGVHFPEVKLIWEQGSIGDALTDNSKENNNYRYHDIFHLGHIAFLGWSPVFRHLMKLKRKSDPITLDTEDRGRPQVAEEAVTLYVYNYAKSNRMLKESDRLDTELLRTVKQLVEDLEVAHVTAFHWEQTILSSYRVFHKLVDNRGGKVLVSPKTRELNYLGK